MSETQNPQEIIVTDRSYLQVLENLSADDLYFKGKKVLSVGEGLSGFANGLADMGVDVVAVDPIYTKSEILSKQPDNWQNISENTRYKTYLASTDQFNPPKKEKVKLVAAKAGDLPFRNGEFELIVANRLFEHVDMQQVLPDLLRVLDDQNGELRLGGVMLSCVPKDRKLISGVYEKVVVDYVLLKNPEFSKALKNMNKNNPEISIYLVVGGLSRYGVLASEGIYGVKNLIFMKSDEIPEVVTDMGDDENDFRGRLYKVDPLTFEMELIEE